MARAAYSRQRRPGRRSPHGSQPRGGRALGLRPRTGRRRSPCRSGGAGGWPWAARRSSGCLRSCAERVGVRLGHATVQDRSSSRDTLTAWLLAPHPAWQPSCAGDLGEGLRKDSGVCVSRWRGNAPQNGERGRRKTRSLDLPGSHSFRASTSAQRNKHSRNHTERRSGRKQENRDDGRMQQRVRRSSQPTMPSITLPCPRLGCPAHGTSMAHPPSNQGATTARDERTLVAVATEPELASGRTPRERHVW